MLKCWCDNKILNKSFYTSSEEPTPLTDATLKLAKKRSALCNDGVIAFSGVMLKHPDVLLFDRKNILEV